jgi:hypothetical protein
MVAAVPRLLSQAERIALQPAKARRNDRAGGSTKQHERRVEPRVAVTRRATLLDGTTALPCLIEDFSTRGFFVISNREFFVGQILELKCELYPARLLMCKIEIRHIKETCLGTRIVEIDKDGTALLDQFLQEYYSVRLAD